MTNLSVFVLQDGGGEKTPHKFTGQTGRRIIVNKKART